MVASCHVDHFVILLMLLLAERLDATSFDATTEGFHLYDISTFAVLSRSCFGSSLVDHQVIIGRSAPITKRSHSVPGLTSIGQWRSTDLRHGQCICSSDVIRCSGDMGYGPWPFQCHVHPTNLKSLPKLHAPSK